MINSSQVHVARGGFVYQDLYCRGSTSGPLVPVVPGVLERCSVKRRESIEILEIWHVHCCDFGEMIHLHEAWFFRTRHAEVREHRIAVEIRSRLVLEVTDLSRQLDVVMPKRVLIADIGRRPA